MTSNKIFPYLLTLVLTAAFILLLPACSQKEKIHGKEFIPRDDLVHIITDIHLMDGITNDMRFYRKYNPEDSIDLYGSIFEKYNTDKDQYKRTIEEYSKYPELLDEVYDEVIMQLNLIIEKEESFEEEDVQTPNKTRVGKRPEKLSPPK